MLDYTKAAIKQTIDDFRKIDYVRNVVTQVLYIAYLTYAIIFTATANSPLLWVNTALFMLSVGYFGFFLYVTTLTPTGKVPTSVKNVFRRCKLALRFYTLSIMLYGLYLTTKNVNPLSVIFTALLIVGWVLQVLFEIVFQFFINRAKFIMEGMEADFETVSKPVRSVGNFFKKMAGQEVEEEKPKSKNRIFLDQKVAEAKQARADKKREDKFLKKEQKIKEKMQKLQQKMKKNSADEQENTDTFTEE